MCQVPRTEPMLHCRRRWVVHTELNYLPCNCHFTALTTKYSRPLSARPYLIISENLRAKLKDDKLPIDAESAREIVAGLRLTVNKVFYHSAACSTSNSPANSFHVHPSLHSICIQGTEFDHSIAALLGTEWANLQTNHHIFNLQHPLTDNSSTIQICSTIPENIHSYLTFFLAARMDIVDAMAPSLGNLIPTNKTSSQPWKKARVDSLLNTHTVTSFSVPNPARHLFIQQVHLLRIRVNGNESHNYQIELPAFQAEKASFSFFLYWAKQFFVTSPCTSSVRHRFLSNMGPQ